MKYLPFFLFIFLFSCEKEDNIYAQDCGMMPRPFFKINRADKAVNLEFAINILPGIMHYPENTCKPEFVDFYISEDNNEFSKIGRFPGETSSIPVDGLENDKFYFFKMVYLHSQLDSLVSPIFSIKPGESNPPILSDKSFPFEIDGYVISNDGEQVIYEAAHKELWYLTSFANPQSGTRLFGESYTPVWFNDDSKIAYTKLLQEDNYIRSHKINIYDLSSNQETTLHTISNPKEYWIHSLEASVDGKSIFFKSNKDNGGTTYQEKHIDNIWKINIETGELEQLSDFFLSNFTLSSFAEDPLKPNNFYVIGKYTSSNKGFNLYYLNTTNQTLIPILEDSISSTFIISPSGNKILLSSERTGISEFWVYDVKTCNLSQITDGYYGHFGRKYNWLEVSWKNNNTLLMYIRSKDEWRFAEFEVE